MQPNMPVYVIHASTSVDREPYVKKLQEKAGAQVFEAVMLSGSYAARRKGNFLSHVGVYKASGDSEVLVFEDDCEIMAANFLEPLKNRSRYDLVYLGLLKAYGRGGSGTHALWVSKRAKQFFLQYVQLHPEMPDQMPIDLFWNKIIEIYGLKVLVPRPVDKYVRQSSAVPSITRSAV